MWTIQRPFNTRGIRGVSRQPEIQEEFFLWTKSLTFVKGVDFKYVYLTTLLGKKKKATTSEKITSEKAQGWMAGRIVSLDTYSQALQL